LFSLLLTITLYFADIELNYSSTNNLWWNRCEIHCYCHMTVTSRDKK